MDEQNAATSTNTSAKTISIIVVVVVLLGAGWLFMRGGGTGMPEGVTMDKNMDGSATYSNEDGSVTVGSNNYPDNWPGDAPKYDNGQIQYSASSNQQTGENGSMITFVTSDSPKQVVDFYKSELVSKGWKIEQTAAVDQMLMLTGTKGTATFYAQVTSADGKQTTAAVVISQK